MSVDIYWPESGLRLTCILIMNKFPVGFQAGPVGLNFAYHFVIFYTPVNMATTNLSMYTCTWFWLFQKTALCVQFCKTWRSKVLAPERVVACLDREQLFQQFLKRIFKRVTATHKARFSWKATGLICDAIFWLDKRVHRFNNPFWM